MPHSFVSDVNKTTWRGPPNDEPPTPIAPGDGDLISNEVLMIGGHVDVVELPFVLHRYQAQAGVDSGERVFLISNMKTMAQLPKIVSHAADV